MFENFLLLTLLALCCSQGAKCNSQDLTELLQDVFASENSDNSGPNRIDGDLDCKTTNSEAGRCTPPRLCSSYETDYEGECPNSDDVCCVEKDLVEPLAKNVDGQKSQKCGIATFQTKALQKQSDEGAIAFAEYPWIVAILRLKNGTYKYTCSGSLISLRVVMTAAHSVLNVSNLVIRAGEWDMRANDEELSYQQRKVERVIVHEKYNTMRGKFCKKQENLHNDIALILLNINLDYMDNVNTLCLPSDPRPPPPGTKCITTGWIDYNSAKKDTDLTTPKKVELSVMDRDACVAKLRQSRLGPYFKLDSSFICTDVELKQNTCIGDGGSPLICPVPMEKDRFMASGIVSWDVECQVYPTAYVDVARFKPWIDAKMAELGYNSSSYTI